MKFIKRVLEMSCAVFLVGCLVPGLVLSATTEDVTRWQKEKAIEPLIRALGDDSSDVQRNAVESLGEIGDACAVKPLTKALEDEDWQVRMIVVETLGKIGDTRAVEPLIAALKDENSFVRRYAADVLGKIGDARAVEPLVAALRDEKYVREDAVEALSKIDPDWHKTDAAKKQLHEFIIALTNHDPDYVKIAVEVLENIDSDWHRSDIAKKMLPEFIYTLLSGIPASKYMAGILNNFSYSIENIITILKLAIVIPLYLEISFIPLLLTLVLMLFLYLLRKNKKQIRYNGVFLVFIFWFSCLFSVWVMFNLLIRHIGFGFYYLLIPIPFVVCNIPCIVFLSMPFVSGKWLRAKRQAKWFVCSRDYHRRFILGPGLPLLVRWSRRILFIERPKQHDDFEDYFVCKTCEKNDSRLMNIRKVIGLIGGVSADYRQKGEKLYINLWNEAEKKALNADIDVLEIHESNGISYDYAVNAVLNVLKNDVSRPRKYVKGIPVIIRGNPTLSENSKMILQHEFGGKRNE